MKKYIDKLRVVVFIVIRISLVYAGIISFLQGDWAYLGMTILTLIMMFLPYIVEKKFRVDIPSIFEIVLVIYIYAAVFLGSTNGFYSVFWWWDKMLHGLSGLIFGNIGFFIVSYLNSNKKINIKLSPGFVALFSFCFAIAIGAIWEIYEYTIDYFFNTTMQNASLDDTMSDIILDTIGALIISIAGYYQEKGIENHLTKFLIKINK
ncbi:hypothetical protein GC105_11660 [Alkalibaculum sp. M08DMB]|uniref:Membrane-spanning protein n=1 Tax=Alkalibaculum sporogenes TaxID=2655001 RepID=A0A6A7KAM5_9FIRM|nr:hypothetical protein [Alkalibaculum sporogenes]MPW26446.1 hypothetical protein [Alkalibaculum sporogenes]